MFVYQRVCQDMTASSFRKLWKMYGSKYVRYDKLPYRSIYPNASEAEFLNKYVGLMYSVSLWPPYVIGGPLYFCPVVSFFYLLSSSSSFFIPRLISAAVDWMSTILLHMAWP